MLSVYRDHGVVPREGREDNNNRPGEDLAAYRLVRPGDLVINKMKTWQGSIAVSSYLGIVSPAYFVAEPSSILIDGAFMHHLLRSQPLIAEYGRRSKGIRPAQWDLPWEEFADIVVAVPSLAEQRAIADFLDWETARIDALITAKRRMIGLLRERELSGVYESVFHSDLAPSSSGAPRTSQLRRLVRQTNAGEVIDKSWWGEGGERLYTCAREALVSNFGPFPEWKRTQINDLLITRNGTPYVHIPEIGSIYSNVVQRISLTGGQNREYVAFALEAVVGGMKAQGVSIDSFNYDMWKALVVPVPDEEAQRGVVRRVGELKAMLRDTITSLEVQIDLLVEHRQALITAAVTGELSVGVAE